MSDLFPALFTPFTIGTVGIRNRILSTGHDTTLPTDGRVNDALVAYHTARAQGGVGLIVTQVAGVHESARYTSHVLMAVDDGCISGFARLAQAVKSHGARVFVQLFHPGREIMESADGTAPVAWAPSAVPSERFHVIPRALPLAMIAEITRGYAQAAVRMQTAGMDGVEIVASHGYLPAQFLNPQVNLRRDAYGGSDTNRRRFLAEVLDAVRAAVGADFVVGLRISSDDRDPDGITEPETLSIIKALAGRLDYVNLIAGTSASLGGATHIVPPMFVENGYLAPFAARVKAAVAIPVLVAGRINQPHEAEAIIAAGQADMCGMTRALICDPAMPAKAQDNRPDDIRACIACNQACIGHFQKGVPISCIQHPETGRELIYDAMVPAERSLNVMVIGGGPAGMKAAATSAARGHRVTLYEAAPRLGGQALLAQLLPGRAEFGGIVTNLAREMVLAGVTVRLGQAVTLDTIAQEQPDRVIVATGGTPYLPEGLALEPAAQVVTAWQVLRNEVNVGASVVIADWRCDWIGLGMAERLALAGCRVRLAVNGIHAGQLVQSYTRDIWMARLHRLGVEIIPYARLYGCDETTAYFLHTASNEPMLMEGVDTLVLALGQQADCALSDQLSAAGIAHEVIGDALSPRSAEEAVYEGLKAGWL